VNRNATIMTDKSGTERLEMIAKGLSEGDDSLAAAALHASRFLTGLTEVEQEHVRQQWATRRQPEALARMKRLETDLDHLERAGQLLLAYQLKCSDPVILATARRNQDAARAAVAAATDEGN
jgi:predicted nucleic acid-binding protein